MVGGPETALSAQQLFGMTVWCSVGAWRMKSVVFPQTVDTIHIFSDAGNEGARAAILAMEEFNRRGLKVTIRPPLEGDWNDVLTGVSHEPDT